MGPTKAVNLRSEPYDIYIGRGKDPKTGQKGAWGNPFHLGDNYNGITLDRTTCLETYESWLTASDEGVRLLESIWTLYGKTLGCWCKPLKCHGDILAGIANTYPPITNFRGDYGFLSNFYGGARALEHDYQAAKARNEQDRYFVLSAETPKEAKRRGCYMIKARDNWEIDKYDVMRSLLEKKFTKPEMRQKLLATGYSKLVEGNTHCDNTWGSCSCPGCGDNGDNFLGMLLMDIRRRIRLGEFKA